VLRCGDVANPVLGMKQGVTYTFDQSDASNWYHPLGFAYNPDGAHKGVDELEPGLLEDWACSKGMQCQAPMYFINDEYVGTYSNIDSDDVAVSEMHGGGTGVKVTTGEDDFGLDVYEPAFFLRREDWLADKYSVKVTLTDKDFTEDFFYFCQKLGRDTPPPSSSSAHPPAPRRPHPQPHVSAHQAARRGR